MPAPSVRQYQVFIERPPDVVFGFVADLRNRARVSATEWPEEVLTDVSSPLSEGGLITLVSSRTGGRERMTLEVIEWHPPESFSERQFEGPFASWEHRRWVSPFQQGTLFSERIEYVPGGALGRVTDRLFLSRRIDAWAQGRQAATKAVLERMARVRAGADGGAP